MTRIDWNTAQIEDRTLTVALHDQPPKGYAKHLAGVVELLAQHAHGWGEITVRKDTITVADVQEGAEDDLRHLLESALLQADADLQPPVEDDGAEDVADAEDGEGGEHAMAATFRGFADDADEH